MKKQLLGAAVAALLLTTAPAEAVPSITFDQVLQGGTIAYSTVGGSLVGTDILFDFVVALGTGADGTYACSSCSLDFTTGAAFGDTDGPLYSFAGGGSFVLTGGIAVMGIADGSTLLTGTWTTSPGNIAVAAGSTVTFIGGGLDDKNPLLTNFLGIDPGQWIYATSEFSLGQATVNPDGTFVGTITQADLQNVLPEPTTVALLALGLLAFGFGSRRQAA